MRKMIRVVAVFMACIVLLAGCGSGITGDFYRYDPSDDSYGDDYFEFSGSSLRYHENGEVYSCDYSKDGGNVDISLDFPGNPLRETFKYNTDEQTLTSEYDVFKKK